MTHAPVRLRPQMARTELQAKAAEAERRAKALAEQRDVLQQQLEKAAAETPGEGASSVPAWPAGMGALALAAAP